MAEIPESNCTDMATAHLAVVPASSLEPIAIEITRQIFPGPISIEDGFDPEEPEHRWRTLIVSVRGDLAEIHSRKTLWHRRMFESLGPSNVLRFTISTVPETP